MTEELRFFSLNKKTDWAKGLTVNLQASDEGLSLNRIEKYGMERTIRLEELEGVSEIYDFAIGSGGKCYLLDDEARLWVYNYENGYLEPLYRRGHGLFSKFAKIACFGDTVFVADFTHERRLAAYSVSNGQSHWHRREWEGIPLFPLALAVQPDSLSAFALVPLEVQAGENGEAEIPEGGRLGIVRFGVSGQMAQAAAVPELKLRQRRKVSHLRSSFFLDIALDGTICLFDSLSHSLFMLSAEGELKSRMMIPPMQFSGLAIDSKRNLYIGDSRNIGAAEEDDRHILNFGVNGETITPVAGYRGRADKLLIDPLDRIFVWNGEAETIALLDLKPRTMMMEATGLLEGVFVSRALDSGEDETVWHKLQAAADIPEETQLRISHYASDRKQLLLNGGWLDLDEYMADETRSAEEKLKELAGIWSPPVLNPKDALFFRAKGRYLWVKVELAGSEQRSPDLRRLRVYYPRTSYLSYLPAVYQEQAENSFLERFLTLFGTFFDDMEDRIDHISRYFDADAAAGEFLRWLGGWLGILVDDSWSDRQVREFIKLAPLLYQRRGTRGGLHEMIRLYIGDDPIIVEHFQVKELLEKPELKELVSRMYGDDPYTFTVLLKPGAIRSDKQRLVVQRIIREQKPAFTEARLVELHPSIYMDMHAYLEMNSYLSEPTLLSLDERSSMPFGTLLTDVERENRLDIHTRLGLDSNLE